MIAAAFYLVGILAALSMICGIVAMVWPSRAVAEEATIWQVQFFGNTVAFFFAALLLVVA